MARRSCLSNVIALGWHHRNTNVGRVVMSFQSLHPVSSGVLVQLMQGSWQKSSSGHREKEDMAVLSTALGDTVMLTVPANGALIHIKVSENFHHSFFFFSNKVILTDCPFFSSNSYLQQSNADSEQGKQKVALKTHSKFLWIWTRRLHFKKCGGKPRCHWCQLIFSRFHFISF